MGTKGLLAATVAIVFVLVFALVMKNKSRVYKTKVMIKKVKELVKLTDLGGGLKITFCDTGDEFFTSDVTPYMKQVLGQAGYVKSTFPVYYIYFLNNGKTYIQYVLGTLEGYSLHSRLMLFDILHCFSREELESYLEDSLMKRTNGSNLFLGNEKEYKFKGTSKKKINNFIHKMKLNVVYNFQ